MADAEFVGLRAVTKTRPRFKPLLISLLVKDAFNLQTLFVFGALVQIILFAVLPHHLAVIPALILAVHAALTTLWQVFCHPQNRFADGAVPGRTTAQLPDTSTGRFGDQPAARPLVVFHFGVRYNHPLGGFSPGAQESVRRFKAMAASMSTDEGHERYGMLGMGRFKGSDRETSNTLLVVFYFRDLEGLHRFAHDPLHRDAWGWLSSSGHGHVAAFHETFVVERGAYENIYLGCPPMLMGDLAVRTRASTGGKGEAEWMSTLVSADRPRLKSMMARMDRIRDNDEGTETSGIFGY